MQSCISRGPSSICRYIVQCFLLEFYGGRLIEQRSGLHQGHIYQGATHTLVQIIYSLWVEAQPHHPISSAIISCSVPIGAAQEAAV